MAAILEGLQILLSNPEALVKGWLKRKAHKLKEQFTEYLTKL
jgi:hypothetical protein